jgi:tetratricopeptide (TPR) repeat protein
MDPRSSGHRVFCIGPGTLPGRTSMRLSSLTNLAVAVAIVASAVDAGAQSLDEQAELKKGRYAYASKNFDEADKMFQRMLDPVAGTLHDKVLVKEARMYWGATLIAKGKKDEALAQFNALLQADPQYEPDPTIFPLEVGTAFIDAQTVSKQRRIEAERQAKLREEQKREQDEAAKKAEIERLRQLETLVGQEHIIDRHSRMVALLPFGVGQFQNGNKALGWFFFTTESLELAGTFVAAADYLFQLHDANTSFTSIAAASIAQQYLDRANEARVANLIFNGALALTAVAGVLEAEIAYVPQFQEVRPRPLPPLPGTSPDAKPGVASSPFPSLTFGAAPLFGAEGRGFAGGMIGVGGKF